MVGVARAEPALSTEPELVIGVYLPLTGASGSFGLSTLDGIKLAIEEHNARPGRKLKLEVLDTAGKPSEAAVVVTRLLDGGAVALLGEVSSSTSIAGAKVAQQRTVPMITPSATSPMVIAAGDMISRACFGDSFQAYAMAKFARDRRWLKIATLVDQAQAYSTDLGKAFATELTKLGGKVVTAQQYKTGDADLEKQLNAIAAANPQAIYIPGYYNDVATIAKQARALGIKVPLLGGDGWDSEQLAKIAGTAIDNSYFVNHFAADAPAAKSFAKAFAAKLKHDPDALAALGYDAARLLADAIKRAPSTSGPDLARAIRSTKKLASVTGPITIDTSGDIAKPAFILKLTAGKPVLAATIPPK
jgi:branched-chain amino acid transport system substrate-binding protein